MNPFCLAHLHSLFDCLGTPSISIAGGTNYVSLSCIPNHLPAPVDLPGLFVRFLHPCLSPESGLNSIQVFWSEQDGVYLIGPITPESPDWTVSGSLPGTYPPLFSIILEGEIEPGPWLYTLGAARLYRNGRALAQGLEFDLHGIRGQILADNTVERLTLARTGELIETGQACGLIVWLQDSTEIPNLPVFCRKLAEPMRARFLKTDRDFSHDELRQAVDMDGLKQVVRNPQDLAALLGLGLQLVPKANIPGEKWEVARYLLDPLILPDFGPAACIDSDLPITEESLAPRWARSAVPEIQEALPAKLARPSETLAVCLVEQIQAGPYSLPHLLLEPGSRITACGEAFTAQRPLLMLARQGRGVRALVGSLLKREQLLTYLISRSGQMAELERCRVILGRNSLKIDPLLAAVWLAGQAVNLARGEASSLGRLRQSVLAVSLATMTEIEAVRRKKLDTSVDKALEQAVQALNERRQKLLARLEKGNT